MRISTVQEICESKLGYVEGKNNDTVAGRWYGLNFNPWCAMDASKTFFDAGRIREVAPKNKPKGFASCDEWLKYLAKNGQLVPIGEMQADDLVFFQLDADAMPDHVGIAKRNNPTKKFAWIYESNTSSGVRGSQSNGDGTYLRKRDYSLIMAVARPKPTKEKKK